MKKTLSRLLCLVLCAALALSAVACNGASSSQAGEAGVFTPGTYSSTQTGMHELTVTVTVDANAVTDIQVEHEETPGVGEPVAESLPQQILELQGLGIDAVAGATLTSNAILEGVTDCLKQAGASDETIAAWQAKSPEVVKEEDAEYTTDVLVGQERDRGGEDQRHGRQHHPERRRHERGGRRQRSGRRA